MNPTLAAVNGTPRIILRAEGAAAGLAGIWLFAASGQSWWLFAALILAPDIAFAAYLAGPRVGAAVYNALHATVGPLLIAALGWWWASDAALGVAGVWFAHVGIDRALGYGLKYASSFQDTHLGRIGRG